MNFPLETCSFITGIKPSLSKALIESLKAPTPGSISESYFIYITRNFSFYSSFSKTPRHRIYISKTIIYYYIHATKPPLKMLSH